MESRFRVLFLIIAMISLSGCAATKNLFGVGDREAPPPTAEPPGQVIDPFRFVRARQQRREDVLAAERHLQTGERHRFQQPIVVDFAESRAAVLILRPVPMVLDTEAPHHVGTLLDIGDRAWVPAQVPGCRGASIPVYPLESDSSQIDAASLAPAVRTP